MHELVKIQKQDGRTGATEPGSRERRRKHSRLSRKSGLEQGVETV